MKYLLASFVFASAFFLNLNSMAADDLLWIKGKAPISKALMAELLTVKKDTSWKQLMRGFNVNREECTSPPKKFSEMPAQKIIRLAEKQSKQGAHCESSYSYAQLMTQHPVMPYWQEGWIRQIVELIRASDYLGAINEANAYIDENPASSYQEDVHFLLLAAVYRKMKSIGHQRSPEWIQFALGFNRDQNKNNPFYLKLSFANYVESFPAGKYLDTVQKMRQEARDLYASYEFHVAHYLARSGQFYAANIRISIILKYGPVVKIFPQALFQSIKNYRSFAATIRSGEAEEERVRLWLRLNPEDTLDREAVAQQIEAVAKAQLEKMQQNLPESEWTKQAAALF